MVGYLKRLYIRLFTRNPYKIVPFNVFAKTEPGQPMGVPETLTSVLITEPGDLIFYPGYPNSFNPKIVEKKIDNDTKYKTGNVYKEADRFLYSLESGHIVGFLGLIYDKASRSVVDESAKLWTENAKYSSFTNLHNLSSPTYLPGVTLSCITIGADGGFYHFLHEVLPKLFFCAKILPHVDQLLMNGPETEWKNKWLVRAGADLNKVLWIDNSSHYRCKQLLFTNRLITDQQIGNWSINALKDLLNVHPAVDSARAEKIIWLTRKNVFDRVITWEDDLLALFPHIEKLDVRNLSVAETIKTFDNATHIISAHGAGLSNIFMCRPGTKILELYPDLSNYQPCYFRISSLCGLEHFVAEVDFNDRKAIQQCSDLLTKFIPD